MDLQLSNSVVVSCLHPSTTESDLQAAFKEFGPLRVKVAIDVVSGKCSGVGIVTFGDKNAVEAAFEKMDDCEIRGNYVTVTRALPFLSVRKGHEIRSTICGSFRVSFYGVGGGLVSPFDEPGQSVSKCA